ncbi:embryonic protein UVS.2-like [Phyllobates terribilis]|uniref:embryonic protein UVS.2-like n=1 Tax=Phyllobates terribilis TaxID=111132 RepID=UPI003CCA7427
MEEQNMRAKAQARKAKPTDRGQRVLGMVIKFNLDKGWGFIREPKRAQDVFVIKRDVESHLQQVLLTVFYWCCLRSSTSVAYCLLLALIVDLLLALVVDLLLALVTDVVLALVMDLPHSSGLLRHVTTLEPFCSDVGCTGANPSWFDRIYNVSSAFPFNISILEITFCRSNIPPPYFVPPPGSFLTGRFLIKDLDIAHNIGRSATLCPKSICLWPSSNDGFVYIPYSISSDFSSYDTIVINAALSDIEDVTCIRFKLKTSETDYITFVASTGCWSSIGHIGGVQYISLEKSGCVWSGIVTHEVLHTLGLNHEHVRRDRDKYVDVQWNNIQSDAISNFQIADTYNKDLTAYDYGSILHYPNTAFSKDGIKPTLVAVLNSSLKLGQEFSMSYLDIKKINSLYKCRGTTQATTPTTMKTTTTTTPITTRTTTTASTTRTTTRNTTTMTQTSMRKTTSTTPTTTRTTTTISPTTTRKTTTKMPTTMRTTTNTSPNTRKTTTTTPTTRTTTTTTTPTTTKTTTTTVNVRLGVSFQTGCGGNLTGPEGALISPNYPQSYPSNACCHWNITTTERFRITFKDFNIEGDDISCQYDKLRIYNGRDFDIMYQLRDFCGQNLPSPITSYTNSMQIVFTSDLSIEKRGFSLVYQKGEVQSDPPD